MRWLLLWLVGSVPLGLVVGRILRNGGLTLPTSRVHTGGMTNTSATTDHTGHGCPDDELFNADRQVFICVQCGEHERAGLHDGTGRCEACQEAQPPRTPQMVRLEVALAKTRYYAADTLEEEIASHAHLVEVETELRDLDGGGCEHTPLEAYDTTPAWDRWDR